MILLHYLLAANKNFGDDDVDSDTEQIEKYAPLNESNMRSLSHTHNAKEFMKPAPHNNEDHIRLNDIAPIVYALSRGTDRIETLKTVDKLTKLCNFGGEVRLAAVKEMMSAGALQCLLSTLARADGWPEVELQISKVISVLVTYEDDWALLQRSAYVILSALYVYIQKTQAKTLEQNSDREIDRNTFNDNNTNVYQQNNNTQEHVIQSDYNTGDIISYLFGQPHLI
jgi:hypothetical protein